MDTPLNLPRVKEHLRYNWWKYVLLVALSLVIWNLYFSMTAYRPPEDKKLVTLIYASGDYPTAQMWLDTVREEHFPDQEEFTAEFVVQDETYGTMVLSTRMVVGDVDLVVVPRSEALSYAESGLLLSLEDKGDIPALCEAAGVDIQRGWWRNTAAGERHLLWIPVSGLPRVCSWLYADPADFCLGIRIQCGNEDNAVELVRLLLQDAAQNPAAAPEATAAP